MKINDIADLYEMANLSPDETGVSHSIFISPSYGVAHSCRVKVCNVRGKMVPTDTFVIDLNNLEIVAGTCKLNTNELEAVKWWIHRNKKVLLDYWKGNINTTQCLMQLKKLKQ